MRHAYNFHDNPERNLFIFFYSPDGLDKMIRGILNILLDHEVFRTAFDEALSEKMGDLFTDFHESLYFNENRLVWKCNMPYKIKPLPLVFMPKKYERQLKGLYVKIGEK